MNSNIRKDYYFNSSQPDMQYLGIFNTFEVSGESDVYICGCSVDLVAKMSGMYMW